ncbi:hydroxyacylglutathione hydrolase protein [Plakobranchus ocellatus]|uniref:Hydroxyacylglutathione hydrolase protein n=1 Tax=Plakobranchus ocellatus TaxID=259542 RepID=A0AAV4AZG6_9GAST|nr:hydroxyacylglutathione hydrolase protein [Plakobranchus ocellatus]
MQRVSFIDAMDVLMLRDVLASQVFLQKNGVGWKNVADNLLQLPVFPPMLTARSVWDRTNLLVCQYEKDRLTNEKSSGIEEEVTEKSILLEELLSLKEEGKRRLTDGKKRRRRRRQQGQL